MPIAIAIATASAPADLRGVDAWINQTLAPVSDAVAAVVFHTVPLAGQPFPLIVGWLIVLALVCTVALGLPQWRGVRHALDLLRGRYADPKETGEVSHFQALSAALSGTVGLGNIAGVAVAVTIGGPGATLWMVVAGLLGMASKFAECTLGVRFRQHHDDGSVSGGPMYYLSDGLAHVGWPRLGRWLAVVFSVCCIGGALGGGNMFQANQAFHQVVNVTGGAASPLVGWGWLFGVVMAVAVGLAIIGGIRTIVRVTEKLVPLMAVLYLGAGLLILALHAAELGPALLRIWHGAFTGEGVAGGAVGALIQGFRRAAFSNEAGIGSASIAHSAVRTGEPFSEGHVALLEPFIDTVVICTVTALVIGVTGVAQPGLTGVELTSAAFAAGLPWFPEVLAVCVLLFAFSTMIAWSYYGLKAWTYLVGQGRRQELAFKLFFCASVVVGSSMQLGPVIDFSDAMVFLMAVPNVIGLYLLMPMLRRDLARYRRRLASGEIRALW
ncbi:alanine/glycine:cation symporter family protein [Hydrogenophaga sp.]|uniref:alanine/glycine:cation symporter family protein n=1 Tax=Hydrogenophaga sp. TaxID=1904254 RepID=UPI002AB980FE|nr:alanine/glycine:cation symporter family protein [Hydrogenophaga sp.]MDZ4396271.1 alanine/glycine:cation symporter family protein [Hydrogenophaga sp.]